MNPPRSSSSSDAKRFPLRQPEHGRLRKNILVGFLLSLTFPWLVHFQIITRFPAELWERLESPQLQAEILATAVAILQYFQFVSCHARSRRKRWLLEPLAWASFYMPVPLAAYAIGVMLRFRPPYWLVAAFFAAGHTDTMTAYSLHDDKQGVRRFTKLTMTLAHFIWFSVAMFQGAPSYRTTWKLSAFKIISVMLACLEFFLGLKIQSSAVLPSDLTMIVANSMKSRDQEGMKSRDQEGSYVVSVGSLESYESAVSGCTTSQEIERLGFSWEINDISLSSALFLQLVQRYSMPGTSSTVNHAFKGLLTGSNSKAPDYKRAIRMVEVQLSFLYDYFFSAASSPSITFHSLYLVYSLFKIIFLSSVITLVLLIDSSIDKPGHVAASCFSFIMVLHVGQLLYCLQSKWFLVSQMCNRAKGLPHSRLITFLTWKKYIDPILFQPATTRQRKIELGQYSLLEDFDCNSAKQRLMGLIGRSQRGIIASYTDLSDEATEETFRTLSNMLYSNTHTHSYEALSWTCRQETLTHTIMIWHIATSYCEIKRSSSRKLDLEIATKLSRYCAYLVAFQPELLPEQSLTTEMVLQQVLQEAQKRLGQTTRSSSMEEKRRKILGLTLPEEAQQTTFQKGVRLGRQLQNLDPHPRWKVMAKFWQDLLLYVAQSDNVVAHIEQLAKGGELVTYLWASLSNVGVLKRGMEEEENRQQPAAGVSLSRQERDTIRSPLSETVSDSSNRSRHSTSRQPAGAPRKKATKKGNPQQPGVAGKI